MVYTDHQSIYLIFGRVGLGIRRMNLGNEELQETGNVYFQLAIRRGSVRGQWHLEIFFKTFDLLKRLRFA
jgi:hypothetical protein